MTESRDYWLRSDKLSAVSAPTLPCVT